MKLISRSFELKLKHPFTISRGTRTVIPSLIVSLEEDGFTGYGEATANPYYHTSTEQFEKELTRKKALIECTTSTDPAAFWQAMYPYFKNNMFLLCALDEAYHDLYARKRGLKLYELWETDLKRLPLSNYTIGIDSIDNMVLKMKEMPWPVYKIKLGTKKDLRIIRALRKHTNAVFRIDANGGWGVDETIRNAPILKSLGVEFIEQPLPADDWAGAHEVFQQSVLPIIADESCILEEDVEKCQGYFHGVNIKLMKCGGLTPAIRMIQKAKLTGMKTMAGCMTESSIGISALAHLAPQLDYIDMDGALLIENDVADGVKLNHGSIQFTNEHGTGATLKS